MKQHEIEINVIPSGTALNPYEKERHGLAISLNKMGKTHYLLVNYKDAIRSHEQALEIYNELYAENPVHSEIAATLNNLGTIHNALGNYQESIAYHYQALKIYSKLSGYDYAYFETIVGHFNIRHFGDYKEARAYHSKKFQKTMSQFGAAADTCPYLNLEFHNYDFHFSAYYEECSHYVYKDLRDAIEFYEQTLYLRNRLDKFYAEEQYSENSFARWYEEESIANFIENNSNL
jgi:tetratricopeptide (TPR) repeat protein